MMDAMLQSIRQWLGELQARERRVLIAGAAVLAALILVVGVFLPMHAAVTTAIRRSERRRADLAWMRRNAPQIQGGAAQLREPTNEPPLVLIGRTAREAGLAGALRGTQPSARGVRVQLQGAPFDALMIWLATLDQRYGLEVASITVDRGARTGTVDANVTFSQPAS